MVTPELKWPSTNLTPSPTNLLATDTPCFGSETSSPNSTLIFWPSMPPASLISVGGLLGALLKLRAEGGVRAGERTGDADHDVRLSATSEHHAGRQCDAGQANDFLILHSP